MSTSDHSATVHTARNSMAKEREPQEKEGISEALNAEEGALPGMATQPAVEPSLILTGKKLAVVFVAMYVPS